MNLQSEWEKSVKNHNIAGSVVHLPCLVTVIMCAFSNLANAPQHLLGPLGTGICSILHQINSPCEYSTTCHNTFLNSIYCMLNFHFYMSGSDQILVPFSKLEFAVSEYHCHSHINCSITD